MDQGTGIRGQGSGDRDQGTGNRGQGRGGNERLDSFFRFSPFSLPPVPCPSHTRTAFRQPIVKRETEMRVFRYLLPPALLIFASAALGAEENWYRSPSPFKEAGATYLIFYDKWIDGFVFHDTKTTRFKTRRDFVRDVSDACHRADLRLGHYFNAVRHGNPEVNHWSLL